uniref:Nucleolar protein 16 n=1 Tax=Trichuris muris TaxID=70415 RepID=A0A5S6QPR4_TRIMR
MPRSVRRGGKKNKRSKFRYRKNTLKARYKRTKRARSTMCSELNAFWNHARSVQKNMTSAGLVYDVNKHFGSLSTTESLKRNSFGEVACKSKESTKTPVVEALEKAASVRPPKRLRLSKGELTFIVSMIEKHGSDYIAMARDSQNIFQLTPSKLRHRVEQFKQITIQYNAYLKAKSEVESGRAVTDTMDVS